MAAQIPDAATRVITAAGELFAERGYAATTTRAIAERAGVNEVTVFRRFGTKAGILRAIADGFAERSAGHAVAVAAHPDDTLGTLTELARTEMAAALRDGGLALRLAFEARSVPEVAEVLGSGSAGNAAGLTGYLAQRQQAGDLRDDLAPDLLAETFFALTSSLVLGRSLMGVPVPTGTEVDRLVAQVVSLFWSGAAVPSASPGSPAASAPITTPASE